MTPEAIEAELDRIHAERRRKQRATIEKALAKRDAENRRKKEHRVREQLARALELVELHKECPPPASGDPTPEQIREMCKQIRAGWKPSEWARQAGQSAEWLPPLVATPEVV
jgi:tRNA A37 N6-isopentenylltransferase MiaA